MLALATLAVVAQTLVPLATCDACAPSTTCEEHLADERLSLPVFVQRYESLFPEGLQLQVQDAEGKLDAYEREQLVERWREAVAEADAERRDVLVQIANLNRVHANAPSADVSRALAVGLVDSAFAVREATVEMLLEGQHEAVVDPLVEALEDVDASFELVGEFERRWEKLGNQAPDIDGVEDVAGIAREIERVVKSNRFAMLFGSSKNTARDKATEELLELHEGLKFLRFASDQEPRLVRALSTHPNARSRGALRKHFKNLIHVAPSRSIPAAQALLEAGARPGVKEVVRALASRRELPDERIGPVDISLCSHEEWRRALHDALTRAAGRLEPSSPAWNDDARELGAAWRAWFDANEARFPEKPG